MKPRILMLLVVFWLAACSWAGQMTASVTFPPDCITASERTELLYRLEEKMRLWHNAQGKALKAAEFHTWKFEVWMPKHWELARRICEWREKAGLNAPDPEKDPQGALAYVAMKARYRASERWNPTPNDITATVGRAPPDPTEDLTSFTETDPNNDFTITASTCTIDTMRRDVDAHVKKSYGAAYFGDYSVNFEWEVTAVSAIGSSALCVLTNNPGSETDQSTGQRFGAYNSSGTFRIALQDRENSNKDYDLGTLNSVRYSTMARSGTTGTLDHYTDANRTNLDDAETITVANTTYQYLQCIQSRESGSSPADTITGYTKDFDIGAAAFVPFPHPVLNEFDGGLE